MKAIGTNRIALIFKRELLLSHHDQWREVRSGCLMRLCQRQLQTTSAKTYHVYALLTCVGLGGRLQIATFWPVNVWWWWGRVVADKRKHCTRRVLSNQVAFWQEF